MGGRNPHVRMSSSLELRSAIGLANGKTKGRGGMGEGGRGSVVAVQLELLVWDGS